MADTPLYHLECHELCSFYPGQALSQEVSDGLADGKSLRVMVIEAKAAGVTTNITTLSRHRKHIVLDKPESAVDVSLPRTSNIEILEAIIAKGFDNRKNWKPTISDTMKAMDMWFKLTQGNPFDELLDALATAGMGEENPQAVDGKKDASSDLDEEDDDA